jgi:hypothetical protein
MTTLAALVADLQSEVPATNGTPTSAQYEKAVKDAVLEFSRLCGLEKIGTLNIVAGTATYDLASDFQKLILLASVEGIGGVIHSVGGLIPVSAGWREEYQIVNRRITIFPTPTYTMTREYHYKMMWVLTGSGADAAYAEMGDNEAQIVLIKAKALALEKKANAQAASGGLKYSFGAVSVDKSAGVENASQTQEALNKKFEDACDAYNGAVIY